MDFYAILDQVVALLRQRQRVTYRALKRHFQLDDAVLEDLTVELIKGQRLAADEDGEVLVWMGEVASGPAPATPAPAPLTYTPPYLAEKILTAKSALEGERKQVTVLFADLKGSMELLADRDPEEARQLLDPVLERMMAAVHRYEGTVNQVMGDGIMALFGAPLAHEDHAVRACYAVLHMQEAIGQYAEELRRQQGLDVQIRVGLNSGEVVVRAIGGDLHMDYTAVGQTTHLAARMEQLARPGTDLLRQNLVPLEGALLWEHFGLPGLPSVMSRTHLALCIAELGAFTEGLAHAEESLRIAEAVNHPDSLSQACRGLGDVYLRKGELHQAIPWLERGLEVSRAWDMPLRFYLVSSTLGYAYVLSGRLSEALPLLEQSASTEVTGIVRGRVDVWLSEAYLRLGRLDEALAVVERDLEFCRTHTHQGDQAWALRLLGEIYARRHPPQAELAEASYREALALAELSTALEMYQAMEMTFWLPETEAALAQIEGR